MARTGSLPRMPAAPAAPGRRSALALETAIVLAVSTLLAVIITWPVAGNVASTMVGPGGDDQLGYLQDFWYFANFGIPLFRDGVQSLVGAPFENPIPALPNLTLAVTLVPAALITKVFGGIVAYNVLTIAGLALTGATMYLACRWIGVGVAAASWGGVAYMVFPYHLLAAQSFVTLVPYWCFPLLLMALLAWTRESTWQSGAAVVGSVGLCALTFPYFVVMALLMATVTAAISFIQQARTRGWMPSLAAPALLMAGLAVLVALPLKIVAAVNPATAADGRLRTLDEVSNLGPTLSEFVTPPRNSAFFTGFVGDGWYGIGSVGGERLVYAGAGVILLLALGLLLGFRSLRRLPPLQRSLMIIGPPMLVVLLIVSLRSPYPIGGGEITTPARWVFEFAPYIRAFGRFIIAIAAIAVLVGALGLHLLMKRVGPMGGKVALTTALLVTGMEAGAALPLPSSTPGQLPEGKNVNTLTTYQWLRARPDRGIVFNQPEILTASLQRPYGFGITVHGHPVLNTTGGGPSGDLQSQVIGPPTRASARLLATAGVRYVVIHAWAYRGLNQKVPGNPPRGFALATRKPDGEAVWRVTASPYDGFVTFTGFGPAGLKYGPTGWQNWRWMFSQGTVRAHVGEPGKYRATFRAAPAGGPHTITAMSPDGSSSSVRVRREGSFSLALNVPNDGAAIALSAQPATRDGAPTVRFSPWLLTRIPS